MKFTLIIEEMIAQPFEVEAESDEAALAIAQEKYQCGEFVLCSGEVQARQIEIESPADFATEWIEF